ncbi:MAG: putative system, component, partial [Firmicutes bacterium]|nr:putative system, component [Bacillota bacterium]
MRILCVCGMGLGSSLLLKMQVESVLKELNTRADSIEIADIGSARAMAADLVVTSPQFA